MLLGWGHDEGHEAPAGDGRFHRGDHWSSVYYRESFTVEQAQQLGYVAASPCEPGMGYHYLKPEEAEAWFEGRAGGLQILLYDDTGFLVGVEYLFTASGLSGVPVLGMVGPMEGHVPGMPSHYDQHIYFVEPQCAVEGGEGG
jgi:hypothetical protein